MTISGLDPCRERGQRRVGRPSSTGARIITTTRVPTRLEHMLSMAITDPRYVAEKLHVDPKLMRQMRRVARKLVTELMSLPL